jgi:hypothetical protein
LRFYEVVGVWVLKIEELELEILCTDSTALAKTSYHFHNFVKKTIILGIMQARTKNYE